MGWLFLIVVCGIAIYCNWNWCWQRMKFARGLAKYLRARINKKPATALLYMVVAVVVFLLWVFGPDLYGLYRGLFYQIKYDGTGDNGDSEITLRYFAFFVAAGGSLAGYFIAIVRNMIADNRNVIAQDKNRIIEQGRITESIGQAITQIGAFNDDKPNIEVRLGGLYSLQRIMQDSPRDTLSIAKIIYAYVRENLKRDKDKRDKLKEYNKQIFSRPEKKFFPLPEDIVSALNIINQFNKEKKGQDEEFSWNEQLNFSHADFSNYSLANMYFVRSILSNANLSNADLQFTNFPRANLCDANLSGAYFYFANFTDALLLNADLSFASLACVNLARANLQFTNFTGASLVNADLSNATCGGANFANADLLQADLSGVDLSSTINLFQEELNGANGDKDTKLPPELTRPDHWNKKSKKAQKNP